MTEGKPRASLAHIETAVRNAFRGTEARFVKLDGHTFHIKPITVRQGDETIITGRISHEISYRPDDQVDYTIRKRGGKVTRVDMNIARGGIASLVGKAYPEIAEWLRKGGTYLDGSWEGAARQIVAVVASRG